MLFDVVVCGIRFSKFTNDEFSPRKLSGVIRVGLICFAVVDCAEFHGFVELELLIELLFRKESLLLLLLMVGTVDVVDVDVFPKKSPNGSLSKSFVGLVFCVGEDKLVALFDVNKSKSSILADDDKLLLLLLLLLLFALDAHGSLFRLRIFDGLLLLFVFVDVLDEDDHGFIKLLLLTSNLLVLFIFVAHGSIVAGVCLTDDNGGKKSSLSVSLTGLLLLCAFELPHGSLEKPPVVESPKSTN